MTPSALTSIAASLIGGVIGGSALLVVGTGPTGFMPGGDTSRISPAAGVIRHSHETSGNPLAGVVGLAQHRGIPDGGPQALEGYVYMDHPAGERIRLALSLIGNAEHAGAGEVDEVRSPGGVVSGPGRVRTWFMHRPVIDVIGEGGIDQVVAYSAEFPQRHVGEKWGVRFDDATVRHRMTGPVDIGELRFPNGWQLRPDGEGLALVRPDGTLERMFR